MQERTHGKTDISGNRIGQVSALSVTFLVKFSLRCFFFPFNCAETFRTIYFCKTLSARLHGLSTRKFNLQQHLISRVTVGSIICTRRYATFSFGALEYFSSKASLMAASHGFKMRINKISLMSKSLNYTKSLQHITMLPHLSIF